MGNVCCKTGNKYQTVKQATQTFTAKTVFGSPRKQGCYKTGLSQCLLY